MRKSQKTQAIKLVELLNQSHDEIKKYIELNNLAIALDLLAQCQSGAIELGNFIEGFEGEDCATVRIIEEYCELIYNIHEEISQAVSKIVSCSQTVNGNKIYKNLRKKLIQIENSVKNDIPLRKEVVFLPYKASMWDSLESIYLAASKDPDCDAYVIPIPYFDRNPDGSMGQEHYEIDLYPEDIPITRYDTYDFGKRRPDMIFIHNPYDGGNMVTSVHPFFYSDKMKKCTDCLVYVPYFATSGGQAESQVSLPAYYNADYIVIQSKRHREYYDKAIPDSKFLAFGSPKFDSVIRKCKNPPGIPDEWKDMMINTDGTKKKVYFYNTSLGGMLGNTQVFLNKLEYVFNIFRAHQEVCLLWRPHPLLESTFESMRPMFKQRFDEIRQRFIDEKIGIYDTTPAIDNTIALSDVYIGDGGTSVTSLFGVVGKPEFILNNYIDTKPKEDDWKGQIINFPLASSDGDYRWVVTEGDRLWHSEDNDFNYKYICGLSHYACAWNYMWARQHGDRVYVFPYSAQDIIVIEGCRQRKIPLTDENIQYGAFAWVLYTEKYAFLIPFNYSCLVRFEFETEGIMYVNNISKFLVGILNGEKVLGATKVVGDKLYMASPVNSQVLIMDIDTFGMTSAMIPMPDNIHGDIGTQFIIPQGEYLWLLPLNGMLLRRWNPDTGEMKAYDKLPEGFKCIKWPYEFECNERPFGNIIFTGNKAILSPTWGNMYVELDIDSAEMRQWNQPEGISGQMRGRNGYYLTSSIGGFMDCQTSDNDGSYIVYNMADRELVRFNPNTNETLKIEISLDKDKLIQLEHGFDEISEGLMYACNENAFNSLEDMINDNITGNPHSLEKQVQAYMRVNASPEGDCGEKIYRHLVRA